MKKLLLLLSFVTGIGFAQSATITPPGVTVKVTWDATSPYATQTGVDSLKTAINSVNTQFVVRNADLLNIQRDFAKLKSSFDSLVQLYEQDPRGIFNTYAPIPSAPGLTSPHTTVDADHYAVGFFNAASLGGGVTTRDIRLQGTFPNGMALNGIVKGVGQNWRFVNYDANTVIGTTSLANHAVQIIGGGNNGFWYGLSPDAPLILRTANFAGSGQTGAQLGSFSTPSNYLIQNAVAEVGTTGFTANFGSGTGTYKTVKLYFLRAFNSGQEGICYIGNTGSTFDLLDTLIVQNCFSYNSARESIQLSGCKYFYVSNNTGLLAGSAGVASQNHGLQIENSNGTATRNIFTSQRPFNIFTHGVTISYQYFEFDTTFGFIGRTDNIAKWAGSAMLNGQPITFDHCYFKWTGAGTLAHMTQIALRDANVSFTNCTLDHITDFYEDIRVAGYTNTLSGAVGSNGNTSATISPVAFVANFSVLGNYQYHGLQTNPVYRFQRMGYRER